MNFDISFFNALLRTLCQGKSVVDARNLHHKLKHDFKPNLMTFNILISGWKCVEEAKSFYKETHDKKKNQT
jgi:pentatricopeptide repeat protein